MKLKQGQLQPRLAVNVKWTICTSEAVTHFYVTLQSAVKHIKTIQMAPPSWTKITLNRGGGGGDFVPFRGNGSMTRIKPCFELSTLASE